MKKKFLAGLLGAMLPGAFLPAQPPPTRTVPPGTPVTITVTPATPASPGVSITLYGRHGHGTQSDPQRLPRGPCRFRRRYRTGAGPERHYCNAVTAPVVQELVSCTFRDLESVP